MICVQFTAFCDLRIRLATLRKSVRKFWFCKLGVDLRRLASPFDQRLNDSHDLCLPINLNT